uniref:Uncharacterized protein n=1 Tax=Nelumbo nucifera TaxID=4432 RepID=A0A822ZRM7_NELNU|nr:TPA_asm: hypothetical protein HUJ06_002718 [Nelumbo nucifera]
MALLVREALPLRDGGTKVKRRRLDRSFSYREITIESTSLKDVDSDKLKMEIKRWAKAVVAYAQEVTRCGSHE